MDFASEKRRFVKSRSKLRKFFVSGYVAAPLCSPFWTGAKPNKK